MKRLRFFFVHGFGSQLMLVAIGIAVGLLARSIYPPPAAQKHEWKFSQAFDEQKAISTAVPEVVLGRVQDQDLNLSSDKPVAKEVGEMPAEEPKDSRQKE